MQPREPTHDVTQLLRAWGQGDQAALDRLMPLVYQELRRIAKRNMVHERPGHTLQATALANEVYLRLVDVAEGQLAGPRTFFRHLRATPCGEFWWISPAHGALKSGAR